MSVPRRLDRIAELRPTFDGFLVDVWGVIHDGTRLFEGVAEAVAELTRDGAKVCFLSNTSRLGEHVCDQLVGLGIARSSFFDAVTSGDVTREALIERRDERLQALLPADRPPRALHLGSTSYVPWLHEIGLSVVGAEGAGEDELVDLVVASGVGPGDAHAQLSPMLKRLARSGVPLVCTNPDRFVPVASGTLSGPGAIAQAYAQEGGETFLFGKPHAPIYEEALRRLGLPKQRVVAVGDMVETDIVGANNAQIASVLIASGVHQRTLGKLPTHEQIVALCSEFSALPHAFMHGFR